MPEQPATERTRPAHRRTKAEPGGCAYCDRMRASGEDFHPSHDASRNCQSGGHEHCSCDRCF